MRALHFICLGFAIWLSGTLLAQAQDLRGEYIAEMNVVIDVQTNGDVLITETIDIVDRPEQSRRGIFRDLPRVVEQDGVNRDLNYDVLRVTREGQSEPYTLMRDGNAQRIRIGDANTYLPNGRHRYQITYSLEEAVWRFSDRDEITWNVTGTYWPYPITKATAQVNLPRGAEPVEVAVYTGSFGANGLDATYTSSGSTVLAETTGVLGARQGLTISVGIPKGAVDPLSTSERSARWWAANGAVVAISLVTPGILLFYVLNWMKVGRDPQGGPVFARYAPPENYSAAAAHRIYFGKVKDHDALIATLLSLAIKGWLKIDVEKKATLITRLSGGEPKDKLNPEEKTLFDKLFSSKRSSLILKKNKPNSSFDRARIFLESQLNQEYSRDYYRLNGKYTFLGIVLSVCGIFMVLARFTVPSGGIFWLLVLALVIANIVFIVIMPAPTKLGAKVKAEIEGFRLYLETAEKARLNAVEIGSGQEPPMTIERYEAFLPYAVALGVEEPWAKYFEGTIPEIAETYQPRHYGGSALRNGGSVRQMQRDMVQRLSSGVESARPIPVASSSSGGSSRSSGGFSSGGGSSGGGMGGGGGGSW